jgi:hypothetical protein
MKNTNPDDNVITFFKHLVGTKGGVKMDAAKELGSLNFSKRTNEYLQLVGEVCNEPEFADFWDKQKALIKRKAIPKRKK